jgi:hypothetical protein
VWRFDLGKQPADDQEIARKEEVAWGARFRGSRKKNSRGDDASLPRSHRGRHGRHRRKQKFTREREIAANPKVELGYLDEHHDQVRVTGTAVVVEDLAVLQSIWEENPLLRNYLGSLENPDLIIYRITPQRVRFRREWALD